MHILLTIFCLILTTINIYGKDRCDFQTLFRGRPSYKNCVFDYAHLLKYTKENKEESLKYFKEKYGIEMLIVTIPSLGEMEIT